MRAAAPSSECGGAWRTSLLGAMLLSFPQKPVQPSLATELCMQSPGRRPSRFCGQGCPVGCLLDMGSLEANQDPRVPVEGRPPGLRISQGVSGITFNHTRLNTSLENEEAPLKDRRLLLFNESSGYLTVTLSFLNCSFLFSIHPEISHDQCCYEVLWLGA